MATPVVSTFTLPAGSAVVTLQSDGDTLATVSARSTTFDRGTRITASLVVLSDQTLSALAAAITAQPLLIALQFNSPAAFRATLSSSAVGILSGSPSSNAPRFFLPNSIEIPAFASLQTHTSVASRQSWPPLQVFDFFASPQANNNCGLDLYYSGTGLGNATVTKGSRFTLNIDCPNDTMSPYAPSR